MLAFGPVPSRRLGRSLGVNNIPPKWCSYSCVYCQLGRTERLTVERREFYPVERIVEDVRRAVEAAGGPGAVDYVTFVPDGEPTLDENLGREIRLVRAETGVPVAVITNSSLIHLEDVRADLAEADLVSVKVDAVGEPAWRAVNRPHPRVPLGERLDSLADFSREFGGILISETMLVGGLNDSEGELRSLASYLGRLRLDAAYLAVPTRPPAERWVEPPDEGTLVMAHQILTEGLDSPVTLLTGYEGSDFSLGEDPVGGLLATTSVHPMRVDYAERALEDAGLDPGEVISRLVAGGEVARVSYRGMDFLIRRLPGRGLDGRRASGAERRL